MDDDPFCVERRAPRSLTMVYKKSAFVAGQLQTVVNEGKNARLMLRNHEYTSEEERQKLLRVVKVAKYFEKLLEAPKRKMSSDSGDSVYD
jgi:hypothetical protein